jgi:hypothetical protein
MLPNELLLHVFSYIPFYSLKLDVQYVCRDWRRCARDILEKRLADSVELLQKAHTTNAKDAQLRSVYDTEEEGEGKPTKFTCWLLGNFEHPSESQVVTGMEVKLHGFDRETGMLEFLPT